MVFSWSTESMGQAAHLNPSYVRKSLLTALWMVYRSATDPKSHNLFLCPTERRSLHVLLPAHGRQPLLAREVSATAPLRV
jgi:hypothetical protein